MPKLRVDLRQRSWLSLMAPWSGADGMPFRVSNGDSSGAPSLNSEVP